MLLENVMENDAKMNNNDQNQAVGFDAEEDDDEEQYTEEEINAQFDQLYQSDVALQELLGENPNNYSAEEKLTIIQAYKKGGGVQGLADIIEDDSQDGADANGLSPDAMNRQLQQEQFQQQQMVDGIPGADADEDEEEMDIDLENPNDVKIIE